jgi:hypothetical protein
MVNLQIFDYSLGVLGRQKILYCQSNDLWLTIKDPKSCKSGCKKVVIIAVVTNFFRLLELLQALRRFKHTAENPTAMFLDVIKMPDAG